MDSQTQDSQSWFVSVDGSQFSHVAFEQCYNEFYRECDTITVCSIADKSKTYLPYDLQPDTIYNRYRTFLLSHIHSSKYKIITNDKKADVSVKDQILQVANESKATALFIGYTGRKGVKAEPTVMGSTTRHAVINTKIPLIITKTLESREKNKSGGFTFLVCLDGSIKANSGLNFVKKLIRSPNDQVVGCMVEAPENADKAVEIRQTFDNFLKETKFKGDFVTLPYQIYIADEIIKFINKGESHTVDFVVIGNSGRRSQLEGVTTLGSVAEKLITHAKANIVLLP